jgi:hypothetical protein
MQAMVGSFLPKVAAFRVTTSGGARVYNKLTRRIDSWQPPKEMQTNAVNLQG